MATSPRLQQENRYAGRRKKLLQLIKSDIAFIPATPQRLYSRDQFYPYSPDSDFYYYTGIEETSAILVLKNTSGSKSILYLQDRNPEEERWVGERIGIKRARRRFKIDDIKSIDEFNKDFPDLVHGTECIHYAPGTSPLVDKLIWDYLSTPVSPQFSKPAILKDIRLISSEMRLIKDKEEIRYLTRASDITARALLELAPELDQMKNEIHCAKVLESIFAKLGSQSTAFTTIVASGKNSTILHHTPSFSPIWKRDLVLIDCGAKFKNYSGDITRVFPVSGKFSNVQSEVYDAVREAVRAAINKAKQGNCLDDIHLAATRSITKSLIELSVLKGNTSKLLSKGAYKPYFMHRTGHWLGIDVHDTSPTKFQGRLIPSQLYPLRPGMAFTIEPGLYFPHDDTNISKELRGIGIRLEEDVLISTKGHEILSKSIPIDREEVEKLF